MTEADLLRQWHVAIAATPYVRLETFAWAARFSGPECIRWQDAGDTHVAVMCPADASTLIMRLNPRIPEVTKIYLRGCAPSYGLQPFRPPAEVWAEILQRVRDARLLNSAATPP